MDEKIVENWNNKVTEHDFVYILGDISFGKPSYTCEILKRLNGKKYLIVGNHDGNKYLRERDFINQFEWIKDYNVEKIFGHYTVMFHFPILHWDREHYGSYHFHGHNHSKNPEILTNRRFDVGLDGSPDFSPYNLETLILKIKMQTEDFYDRTRI